MKTSAVSWVALATLALGARAGTPDTEIIEPQPAPRSGLWQWFIGGSAGYLTDLEEGMYSLQVGMETDAANGRGSHAIYLQAGFTQSDESYRSAPPAGTVGGRTVWSQFDSDLVPLTLNYKYQAPLFGPLEGYVGLGAGVVFTDSSVDWRWTQAVAPPNGQGAGSYSESDVRFYGEVFAGLAYPITGNFEVFTGARYILMDESDHRVPVAGVPARELGIDGDVLIELGVRGRF